MTESGEKTKREALVENRQKEGLEVSRREMLILSNCMACMQHSIPDRKSKISASFAMDWNIEYQLIIIGNTGWIRAGKVQRPASGALLKFSTRCLAEKAASPLGVRLFS